MTKERRPVVTQEHNIPIYAPTLGPEEEANVLDCLRSTWISSKGKYIAEFETAFADQCGMKFATSVCNGTVALHLALVALGIGPEDEVIVPTLTYIASANAITYTGATPVFCDCDPMTWQISPADIEAKITSRTRAIMPVHLYGGACDMRAIMKIAQKYGLLVVEDCAEAIGTYADGAHVGNFGDIATFSFFGNKTITTGEGGMVVTNNQTLAGRASHFRGQGLAVHRQYWHDVIGFNYRMTNICAAIGLPQLQRSKGFLARKAEIFDVYHTQLAELPLQFQKSYPNTTHSQWLVSILTRNATEREALRAWLSADRIETRPVFYPIHTMPIYAQNFRPLPVSEDISQRGISLPSWPGLTDEDVAYVIASIRSFYETKHG